MRTAASERLDKITGLPDFLGPCHLADFRKQFKLNEFWFHMLSSKTLADCVIQEYRTLCYALAEAIHLQEREAAKEAQEKIASVKASITRPDNYQRNFEVLKVYGIKAEEVYAALESSLNMLAEGKPADAEKELAGLRKSIEDKVNAIHSVS